MDLTHRFHVPADLDATWTHFQDVAGLAGCFPGAQVTAVDGDEFTGSCKVKLGPIALVYTGTGTFTERDESAHRLVVEAKGRDKRGNGTAAATATLTMSQVAAGGTDVEVVTELSVTGKPAQFGRGLIQEVSDKLLGQFVGCLEQQLSPDESEPEPVATIGPGPAADTAGPDLAATAPAGAQVPGSPVPTPAPVSTPAPTPAPRPAPAVRPRPAPAVPDALDLGTTVLPVLVRSYWRQALAGVIALAILVRLVRRRSGG